MVITDKNIVCEVCNKEVIPTGRHQKVCSDCRVEYYTNYRKSWYYSDHEQNKKKNKEKIKKFRQSNPEKYLLISSKNRAKTKGIEFNLRLKDIVIPKCCPILDTEFIRGTESAASLDRIDSTKGYTRDNIQVISRKANVMKNNATQEELMRFAEWVKKTYQP